MAYGVRHKIKVMSLQGYVVLDPDFEIFTAGSKSNGSTSTPIGQ